MAGFCKKGSFSESLVAVEPRLGLIHTGQVNHHSMHATYMLTVQETSGLTKTLKRFWELESVGITKTKNTVMSQKEKLVADFTKGLKFNGKNYEVRLPRKHNPLKLENVYMEAVKWLESIQR